MCIGHETGFWVISTTSHMLMLPTVSGMTVYTQSVPLTKCPVRDMLDIVTDSLNTVGVEG